MVTQVVVAEPYPRVEGLQVDRQLAPEGRGALRESRFPYRVGLRFEAAPDRHGAGDTHDAVSTRQELSAASALVAGKATSRAASHEIHLTEAGAPGVGGRTDLPTRLLRRIHCFAPPLPVCARRGS